MLSPAAFLVLADNHRVPGYTLRFFIHILATFDLCRYRILHVRRLAQQFNKTEAVIQQYLDTLVEVGILEAGPRGKIRGKGTPLNTYRLCPSMTVSPKEMMDWFRECREREEREMLVVAKAAV